MKLYSLQAMPLDSRVRGNDGLKYAIGEGKLGFLLCQANCRNRITHYAIRFFAVVD